MGQRVRVIPDRWMPTGDAEVVSNTPRDKSLVVFGAIPGEKAEVHVTHVGRNQDVGVWEASPEPSEHRVEPPCDRYRPCGGCPLMHLDEKGQRWARRALVRDALDHVDLGGVQIGKFHECPDGISDYRHVVKLAIGRSDRGHLRVGAWGRGNRRVVPIPQCVVAAPVLRETMAGLAHHIIDMGIQPFEPESGRGVLRAVVLRASRATGEVLVTFVAGRRPRMLHELAERVAEAVSHVAGVWVHVNSGPGNAIFVRDDDGVVGVSALIGKGWIEERLGDVAVRIGPGDFYQTNPSTAEVLVERTIERMALTPEDSVVDLYCGVGGLTLHAARRASWVIGVEEVDGAVTRARENAHLNGLNAEFTAGRVGEVLPELTKRLAGLRPVVAVNPARRGLEEGVAEAIVALQPRRIAYISCNPRALARDLAHLHALGGYRIGPVDAFDMFPNTAHVELLTVLESPDDAPAERRAPKRAVVRGPRS